MRKSLRTNKYTVAIVGFAEPHRSQAPWDDPRTEIWTINEAHVYHADDERSFISTKKRWVRRWDRIFQIHQEDDFRRARHPIQHHLAWLQEQDGSFPIYMQEDFWDIPAAERYPLQEIIDTLLGSVTRGPDKDVVLYFTSTIAYQIALFEYEMKILRGLNPDDCLLELYGADMAAGTEYIHQKGSTEYWLGRLDGGGFHIWMPEESKILNAPLYAYETGQRIMRSTLEARLELLKQSEQEGVDYRDHVTRPALKSADKDDPSYKAFMEADITAVNKVNRRGGRRQLIEKLIDDIVMQQPITEGSMPGLNSVGRGEIELLYRALQRGYQANLKEHTQLAGQREWVGALLSDAIQHNKPRNLARYQKESVDLLRKHTQVSGTVSTLLGHLRELEDLMEFVDMKSINYLKFVDEEPMEPEEINGTAVEEEED